MNIYKKIVNCFIISLLTSSAFAQTTTVTGSITGAATNVTVTIKGTDFEQTVTLDAQGNYQFDNVPVGEEMTITPSKEDNYLNGVSTFDMVNGMRHILVEAPFDETRKYLAADLNQSGSISIMDIILQRRLILAEITELQNVESWQFVEQQQFEAIEMDACSFTNDFTNTFQISEGQSTEFNFVAIKIADISGNAVE